MWLQILWFSKNIIVKKLLWLEWIAKVRLEGHASCERLRVFRKIKRARPPEISKKKRRMKSGPTGRGYNATEYTNRNKFYHTKSVYGLKLRAKGFWQLPWRSWSLCPCCYKWTSFSSFSIITDKKWGGLYIGQQLPCGQHIVVQGVPPICLQLRTKSWKLKNHIRQKISPVLKFLNKKLLDGILKLGKIKFKVFLNWISKKNVKSEKWFCTLPPQLIMSPAPLPPGKKNFFAPCHLNW